MGREANPMTPPNPKSLTNPRNPRSLLISRTRQRKSLPNPTKTPTIPASPTRSWKRQRKIVRLKRKIARRKISRRKIARKKIARRKTARRRTVRKRRRMTRTVPHLPANPRVAQIVMARRTRRSLAARTQVKRKRTRTSVSRSRATSRSLVTGAAVTPRKSAAVTPRKRNERTPRRILPGSVPQIKRKGRTTRRTIDLIKRRTRRKIRGRERIQRMRRKKKKEEKKKKEKNSPRLGGREKERGKGQKG